LQWQERQETTVIWRSFINSEETRGQQYCAGQRKKLAEGFDDLVVILQEPSDPAEDTPYEKMVAASPTLQALEETLQLAFRGKRCLDDTIMLDRRPFRSARIRCKDGERERQQNDIAAHQGFEAVMACLCPKVILICQCEIETPVDRCYSATLSSSIPQAGEYFIQEWPNKHRSLCVYSFHPMYFLYMGSKRNTVKRVLSKISVRRHVCRCCESTYRSPVLMFWSTESQRLSKA
jgi:hypothetical protein